MPRLENYLVVVDWSPHSEEPVLVRPRYGVPVVSELKAYHDAGGDLSNPEDLEKLERFLLERGCEVTQAGAYFDLTHPEDLGQIKEYAMSGERDSPTRLEAPAPCPI